MTDEKDIGSKGSEDFDFTGANAAGEKPKEELPPEDEVNALARLSGKLGAKGKEIKKLKKEIATSGSPTAKVIAEARKLAGSKTGLDIDKFFTKHRLINVDIEQLLHAPLKKDGTYA